MFHLYGIVEPHAPCSRNGLDGQPLIRVGCGDVAAIASDHAESLDAGPLEGMLWEHEEVLEALLEAGPVLPARFGVRFADREALRVEVQSRSAEFAKALARVRGRVEVSVRLLAREDAPEPTDEHVDRAAGPGARYLLERLGERREAARKLESVRTRLAPLAIAERSRLLPRPGTPASAAFLVERSDLERFRREAQELERELQDVALVCTGPWPPYNFADESLREIL
jgi:Gas vesicle synthesis protein GvpL/GvpF